MNLWLKILVTFIAAPCLGYSNVDNFEGKIKLIKEGVYDTVQIEISVKNNIVRIDEISTSNRVIKSYLVNLTKEKIYALSYKEKLYTEIRLIPHAQTTGNVEFIKTQNSMEINGELCYQWRVKDKDRNTELTYWVSPHSYSFIKSLTNILSRSEVPIGLLYHFPQINGHIPMLTVERTLLRKIKESIKVLNIKSQPLPANLFAIPPDFRELLG